MKIDPAVTTGLAWRDYFCPVKKAMRDRALQYAGDQGLFPMEELSTLNQNGTRLPSHPDRLKTRGVDATTGSPGQGISIAGGMALSQ